ncbi:MAG: hypothetical protein ABWJ98_04200 [Hydrogenothermaceae bacterium]
MKKIYLTSLKKNEHLSKLYEVLKEFNIDSKNLLKNLKENKPFVIILNSTDAERFTEKIQEIANFTIEDLPENEAEAIDRWGVLSVLILDLIFVISVVEITFKAIDVYNIVLDIINISKLTTILVDVLKILLIFVIFKGILNISSSTLVGYIFKIYYYGNVKNLIMFILLPVIGFYMINMGFGKIYEVFGIFLILFFIVSILVAFENLDIKFKKNF